MFCCRQIQQIFEAPQQAYTLVILIVVLFTQPHRFSSNKHLDPNSDMRSEGRSNKIVRKRSQQSIQSKSLPGKRDLFDF